MSEYKNIIGKGVRFLSSNLDNDQAEGQIWYNSTDKVFRNVLGVKAWSSAAPTSVSTGAQGFGFGTQTAGVVGLGEVGPPGLTPAVTEHYNGNGWATSGNFPTVTREVKGTGTQTAGLAAGGVPPATPASDKAFEYDGSSWSSETTMGQNKRSGGMFGIQTAAIYCGGSPSTPGLTNNTESYNGSSWSELNNMPVNKQTFATAGTSTAAIASGGRLAPGPSTNSTDEWDGTNWTAGPNLNTGRRYTQGFGIQTSALVCGGAETAPTATGKTELYDGTSWSESGDLATARAFAGTSQNSASNTTGWLAKGNNAVGTAFYSLTEEWNDTVNVITAAAWSSGGNMSTAKYGAANWGIQTSAVSATGIPPANQSSNNTQEYNGSTWTSGTNYPSQRQSASGAGASESSGLAFGGAIPSNVQPSFTFHNDTQEYDGSSWTAGGNYPQTISSQGSSGTQTAAISVGGTNTAPGSPGLTTLAANYNGSSWTAIPSASNARGWGDGMTGTQTSALAVHSSPNVTEEYNGSSWTTGGTTNVNRSGIALSGTSNTDALGFGGNPAITSAESYDGTSFITSASLATGRDAMGGVGTGPAALGFGGTNNPPNFTATEEFTAETSALNIKTITTS